MQRFEFLSAEESAIYEESLEYDPSIAEIRRAEERAKRIVKKLTEKKHG